MYHVIRGKHDYNKSQKVTDKYFKILLQIIYIQDTRMRFWIEYFENKLKINILYLSSSFKQAVILGTNTK